MVSMSNGIIEVADDQEETRGPRAGIKLTLAQACIIVQRHLGVQAKSFTYVQRGYNNRTYIITPETSEGTHDPTYVIRVCGKFWTRMKTENEVAAIIYLTKKCPTLPLPTVLGYCTDKDASGVGVEYILMKTLRGRPLDDFWLGELDFAVRKNIMTEIGRYLADFRSLTFSKIGSFQFSETIGNTFGIGIEPKTLRLEDIVIGPGLETKAGPFETYLEFLHATFATEVNYFKQCPFMLEGDVLLPRIEDFIRKVLDPNTTPLPLEAIQPKFVMTHGDFEPRNILVDEKDFTITGLLDWEFSGSFPVDNDWYASFVAFGCNTSEWSIFGEAPVVSDDYPDPKAIAPVREEFVRILD